MAAARVCRSLPYPEAGAEPERPPPALPSVLLEEIFLRVASPADLARASAACVSFRCLIADHSFLRRYRSIHPPLLLGFVTYSGFHPVDSFHPSAAVARAVAGAADFSFDWCLCDVSNGRVLLEHDSEKGLELAVCDPLSRSRRYLPLLPITDDPLNSVEPQNQNILLFEPCFIPSGGVEEDTSFSVIRWMQSDSKLGVFVFSSVSGCWSVTSTDCIAPGLNLVHMLDSVQCAYGCLYWKLGSMSTLVKLDMNTMQFCTVDLPPGHDEHQIIIVESGESKVGMFSLGYKGASVDYYTFSQNGSDKSHVWHMMSTIPLPAHYTFKRYIGGPAEGYNFIECIRDRKSSRYSTVVSLDIKSFNIERVSTTREFLGPAYPYFGFPPSMSPRRI